jgi:hypothetical protein
MLPKKAKTATRARRGHRRSIASRRRHSVQRIAIVLPRRKDRG